MYQGPDEVYDSGHEPSDEDELKAYQTLFSLRGDENRDVGQSSTQPPPRPPTSHEEDDSISSPTLEDQVHYLIRRFDAFWDETQEHQVSLSQEVDAIKATMNTILSNQEIIKQQLPQILAYHTPLIAP